MNRKDAKIAKDAIESDIEFRARRFGFLLNRDGLPMKDRIVCLVNE